MKYSELGHTWKYISSTAVLQSLENSKWACQIIGERSDGQHFYVNYMPFEQPLYDVLETFHSFLDWTDGQIVESMNSEKRVVVENEDTINP